MLRDGRGLLPAAADSRTHLRDLPVELPALAAESVQPVLQIIHEPRRSPKIPVSRECLVLPVDSAEFLRKLSFPLLKSRLLLIKGLDFALKLPDLLLSVSLPRLTADKARLILSRDRAGENAHPPGSVRMGRCHTIAFVSNISENLRCPVI